MCFITTIIILALDSIETTCVCLFGNLFIPVPLHPRNLGFWISGFQAVDSGFFALFPLFIYLCFQLYSLLQSPEFWIPQAKFPKWRQFSYSFIIIMQEPITWAPELSQLALMPGSLLENSKEFLAGIESSRAKQCKYKRIIKSSPFWNKVYAGINGWMERRWRGGGG